MPTITLVYLTANCAWMFTFGDARLSLHNCPMFFPTRQEAVDAAKELGLEVLDTNEVRAFTNCGLCGRPLDEHDDPTLACPWADEPEPEEG